MKHWLFPILCALAVHTALFKFDLDIVRPVLTIPESRAVTISLVESPHPAVVQKVAAPHKMKKPRPERKKIEPIPPKPLPKAEAMQAPAPLTQKPLPPALLPEAPPPVDAEHLETGSTPIDETAASAGPSSEKHNFGSDQARVRASVPLYHLNPVPVYPAVARRRNYQGTVLLDVLVDRHGRAARVKVGRSCGYAVLDRSALKSVRQWRFEPARRFGQAVEMWVQVPVRFELE